MADDKDDMITLVLTQEQVDLLSECVGEKYELADNDDDAQELSDLHVALGFAPLMDDDDHSEE